MNAPKPSARMKTIYKFHWHVALTHFPISLLAVAFGFQALDLIFEQDRLILSSDLVFLCGVAIMVPTVITGWVTWKNSYKGAKIMLFQRKLVLAYAMLAVAVPLAVWRGIFFGSLDATWSSPLYWIFMFGTALLIAGAITEGYYGGRLNHR
jgi:uncharacterized membrane protein